MGIECRICSAVNDVNDMYCHECGQKLQLVCLDCNTIAKPTGRFCTNCGKPLPATPVALKQFHALRTEGGERKLLTVLFADLKDFYSVSREP